MNPLLKLVAIANAYDENELDDEARKFPVRADDNEPKDIILYSGRGGKTLLTLQDCLDAREYIKNQKLSNFDMKKALDER